MADFISELRERRVIPAVGVYVASCWLVVEILDRLVERYLLSPFLTDIVFWGLFSLIPAVVLVAWSYGRPGKDTATVAQKVGVPVNLLATAGLLLVIFGDKHLGVTAEVVTVANEVGVEETHIVPKSSQRKRVAVFFYRNESGDAGLDWFSQGAAELLTQDLQQDPFVLATSPYAGWGAGSYARMKAAGYEDGVGVPRTLLREIANDANRQFFTEGFIARENNEWVLTTRVWETASMRQVDEIRVQAWDPYSLLDETALHVREAMEVPSINIPGHEDLPLADIYGESEAALKTYIKAMNTRLFTNDITAANQLLDETIAQEPGFVLAHFVKALNQIESGDMQSATVSLNAAQELDYRLPAIDRATLRALLYRTSGQTEKLIEFVRLQTRLRDDATSHSQLGYLLMAAGDLDGAKAAYLGALERDSLNTEQYLVLSGVERARGDMESAIDFARRYKEARPEAMDAHITLGDMLRDTGELDQAEEHYLQAQLLEPETVEPILMQQIIASRRGDVVLARALLEEAFDVARTPQQVALVHNFASFLEARFGRVGAAIEQLRAAEPLLAEIQAPFTVVLSIHAPISAYFLSIQDPVSAREVLSEGKALLQPPLDGFLSGVESNIASHEGNFEAAYEYVENFEATIRLLALDAILFQVALSKAYISAHEGDDAAAASFMASAIAQVETSFVAAQLHSVAMPGFYAQLASRRLAAGDSAGAEAALELGFKLDPALPHLWLARAELEAATGLESEAVTSLNKVLSAWSDAHEGLTEMKRVRALSKDLGVSF